jgi:hypothetical protein
VLKAFVMQASAAGCGSSQAARVDCRPALSLPTDGHAGSLLAKTLIIHAQPAGRIGVILVPESLGF